MFTHGLKNCHVEGLYSMMMDEDHRMFVCLEWTELSVNDFGDAVGFHNHHREINIKVIHGELVNIDAFMTHRDTDVLPHKMWKWDSKPRGGEGDFVQVKSNETNLSYRLLHTMLNPGTGGIRLRTCDLHSVKQLTKSCAWIVSEVGPSIETQTVNWSRNNLSKWSAHNKYVPMNDNDLLKMEAFAKPLYEKAMECSLPTR